MIFEIVSAIREIETIAEGSGLRVRNLLIRRHGKGRWKRKKASQLLDSEMAVFGLPRFIGTKPMESARKILSLSSRSWIDIWKLRNLLFA